VPNSDLLVTGAGGFIGGAVARVLAVPPGAIVRGATRDARSLGAGITPCRLDVREAASLGAALSGVDAVVHCAVGDRDTTVEGTRTLLRVARECGVRRVVHLSSVAVYGGATGAVDEATPLVAPEGQGYAHWKSAAEAVCREAATTGLEIIMLRPAIVYGPGSRSWITLPAERVMSGAWGGLGAAGRGTCNPVHVRDVAEACRAAIHAPVSAAGDAFNISGAETLSWSGWYDRLAQALGRPALRDLSPAAWRRRMASGLPFKALARVAPAAGRVFQRQILASPARSELALFALQATYPTAKAAARLGWSARIGLDEGLRESIAWFQSIKTRLV
jgi:nucleoside-diphosphate-sugar epimerase